MNIEVIIREKQGTIIDVRTPEEFRGGNADYSINIPLQSIPDQLDELKKLKTPLVLCCASGNRSKQAERFLARHKIECLDGGSWLNIRQLQSQSLKTI